MREGEGDGEGERDTGGGVDGERGDICILSMMYKK